MSAAVNGGCWVYFSFLPGQPGWNIFGGTSEASPIFSGIVALANQVAGHRLGLINRRFTCSARCTTPGSPVPASWTSPRATTPSAA